MFFNFVQHSDPETTDKTHDQSSAASVPVVLASPFLPPVEGYVSLVGERIPELPKHLPAVYRRHITDVHFAIASKDDDVLSQTITNSTDLIPGVYEGGAKTWECSIDLAQFLLEDAAVPAGSLVLELGCGSAVPSLALLSSLGSSLGALTLQDYNAEVLELVTAPNVLLNSALDRQQAQDDVFDTLLPFDKLPHFVSFVAGDWSTMLNAVLPHGKYDLILTSETIYSPRAENLLRLIEARLAKNGRALVAAKSSYFGCAGSIPDFLNLVQAGGVLTHKFVRTIADRGVRCEIIELTHLNKEQ